MVSVEVSEDGLPGAANGRWPAINVTSLGTIEWANDAFARSIGRNASDLPGRSLFDLVHPDDVDAVAGLLRQPNATSIELRFFVAGGENHYLILGPQDGVESALSRTLLACDVTPYRAAQNTAAQRELAARANARRYSEIIQSASDWVWEMDSELRYTYFSPNLQQLTNLVPKAIIGKRRDEIGDPSLEPEKWTEHFATLRSHKPFRDFVYRSKQPDGRSLWIKVSGTPVFGEDGRFTGYRGVASDATRQIAAEHAVAESEKRLRELFEVASDWFWETDAKGRFTFLSSAWSRVTGQDPLEYLGRRRDEFGDRVEDPEAWREHLATLSAHKPFRDFTYCMGSASGKWRWIRTSGIPCFDESGAFTGYRGAATDMTAEMDSIRRERAFHQRFAEVIESIPASLMVHDEEDRLVICNSLARTYFPRTGHLLVPGSTFEDFVRAMAATGEIPEARGREEEWFRERMRRHRLPENHITRQYADGRWVQISERRMSDGGTIGIRLDITELKKAEVQRLGLAEQLQHSQKLEALGTLASGIAHELNNALVPVLALAKLTTKHLPQGSRERRNLDTIREAAERARDLVKKIVAFGRRETPTRSSVDLFALVQASLELLRPAIPSTVRIEERFERVPMLLADQDQLHQVVINLVANAAQAIGDQHGTISIELATAHDAQSLQDSPTLSDSSVRLSVGDTGCGMDEATMKHIFEPFFTTKAVGHGTGLGLSVVHGIITQHGGRIEVTSRLGRGTCFHVYLPLFASDPARAETAETSSSSSTNKIV